MKKPSSSGLRRLHRNTELRRPLPLPCSKATDLRPSPSVDGPDDVRTALVRVLKLLGASEWWPSKPGLLSECSEGKAYSLQWLCWISFQALESP